MADECYDRKYWVQVFTPKTWQEFLAAGGKVTGFRHIRWGVIQQLKPKDYLLCYLSGISSWIGILEVQSSPYLDTQPIWSDDLYPARADVKVVVALEQNMAVPIKQLRDHLSIFKAKHWSLYLISSPSKWSAGDADVVIQAIYNAGSIPSHQQ
jgi:hypothetical protein